MREKERDEEGKWKRRKGRKGKSHSMRDRERKKHKGLCKRDTGDSPCFSFKGQLIDRGRTGEEAWGCPGAGRGGFGPAVSRQMERRGEKRKGERGSGNGERERV